MKLSIYVLNVKKGRGMEINMDKKYIQIKNECLKATTNNPIELILDLMQKDYISIHGPEHHVLDGACFLTALSNSGLKIDLEKALDEMIERGRKMPGATCGQWGMCGSAASIGAALAIVRETGPLSNNQYYKDNLKYVSQALGKIAAIGGPRCCKRNAFLSICTAVDFVNENYELKLPKSNIQCIFSEKNKQCLGRNCPFFSSSNR